MVIIFMSFSCKKKNNTMIKDVSPDTTSKKTPDFQLLQEKKDSFDLNIFKNYLNKTVFKEKNNVFSAKQDTLLIEDWMLRNKESNTYYFLITNSKNIMRYEFDNTKINIEILHITTNSNHKVNELFSYIQMKGKNNSSVDSTPGLTYENDYVFIYENSIYWLNSPCLVSYKNHLLLSNFLRKMISQNSNNVTNELFCECGKVKCEN